jgi:hypothetical protein
VTEEDLEKAIDRFDRRYKTFINEGLCEDMAYKLSEQMYERDKDPQDDRRVCFECANYVSNLCMKMRNRKGKPDMPLRFVLQRCDHFELKGRK